LTVHKIDNENYLRRSEFNW